MQKLLVLWQSAKNPNNLGKFCQIRPQGPRSAAFKIAYVSPVGGPENTWRQGENPNLNDFA